MYSLMVKEVHHLTSVAFNKSILTPVIMSLSPTHVIKWHALRTCRNMILVVKMDTKPQLGPFIMKSFEIKLKS